MNATLKRNPLPATPEWLKAENTFRSVGVDRENNILRGMVIAEEGPFKSDGRGAFDIKGLKKIRALMNKDPDGLLSNYGHPNDSGERASPPDYHLGRVFNPRIDILKYKRNGEDVITQAVRGDLHFAKTALGFTKRNGEWVFEPNEQNSRGLRIMDLAEDDPKALSSSLQLKADRVEQLDERGRPKLDSNGNPLPPLWYPTELHASDVVKVGDAVHGGILSACLAALPDNAKAESIDPAQLAKGHWIDVRRLARYPVPFVTELLKAMFRDDPREVVEPRLQAFLTRCLNNHFGEPAVANEVEEQTSETTAGENAGAKGKCLTREAVELATILAERRSV